MKKEESKKDTSPKAEEIKEDKKLVSDEDNKYVKVEKDALAKILEKVEKQDKTIEMLKFTADKGRIQQWEEKNIGKLIKIIKLSVLEDRIILGWKMIKNDVFLNKSTGVLHEDQQVRVYFERDAEGEYDEENEENYRDLDYLNFIRQPKKIEAEVIEEGKNREGQVYFTVQLPDGKKLKISELFVN
jgi:hypothetical protein